MSFRAASRYRSKRSVWRYGGCGPPVPGPSSQSRPIQRKERSSCSTDSSVERSRSVSSIRSTNVPPFLRAKSQLKSAVRTPPTCSLPVGLDASSHLVADAAFALEPEDRGTLGTQQFPPDTLVCQGAFLVAVALGLLAMAGREAPAAVVV